MREVVVGATHRLRAEGNIPLSAFLNQKMKFGGKFQLNTPSGEPFAGIDYEIEAQIPFDNAASLYMTKMNASGYKIKQSDSPASDGAENTLIIRILRGENFESVFEDELPSCYCLYTFYIYQNQEQFTNCKRIIKGSHVCSVDLKTIKIVQKFELIKVNLNNKIKFKSRMELHS